MKPNQRTIGGVAAVEGVGLHTGLRSTLVFEPAPEDSGVVFVRDDLPGSPIIPADIAHVVDTARGTTLGVNGVRVMTVEHVLAAVAGLGIDNLRVKVNEVEAPVGDGSALPFVKALRGAGIVEQSREKRPLEIKETVSYDRDGVNIVLLPYDGFKISFLIEYNHKVLGTQYASFEISDVVFAKEIAPARTFTFGYEVEMLQKAGLIKGGSLENAVVVGDDGILNEGSLRFSNEFVRHKIVDLIGDFFLIGVPLNAHVIAAKSGHAANVEVVRILRKKLESNDGSIGALKTRTIPKAPVYAEDILKIMPHRYPFLLVDRILEIEGRKRIVGLKNVTINEPYFQGHFPGVPVMPGVLIIEAMAQVGGLLLLSSLEDYENKMVFFTGIDRARFRKPVRPGDQIRFEVEMLRFGGSTAKMAARGFVEGRLIAEAELMCSVTPR
ncbi:bifunctional UDP-3-O-[3-hydroxymyristoyl] N-acetylglucosamine deacetylase/3-hydroxyacyl-ACP dehydratase [Candidatus Fermentibacteria bacterium]|nr:bifunctional UDP-3-O-[3-hydroxymyristoyl] N-acetylglucosamine deacetylase/3-hydroxyacyl-ACP dehydratase [Candidatus Fermentibacteria bacterium]